MSDENDACMDCGKPTVFQDAHGDPLCCPCFDNRQESAWERQMAAGLADGGSTPTTPSERMADAYAQKRAGR